MGLGRRVYFALCFCLLPLALEAPHVRVGINMSDLSHALTVSLLVTGVTSSLSVIVLEIKFHVHALRQKNVYTYVYIYVHMYRRNGICVYNA